MKRTSLFFVTMLVLVSFVLSACGAATPAPTAEPAATEAPAPTEEPAATEPPAPAIPEMILATTTSTQDSGLLDVLIPAFEAATGYTVQVVAVGSGAALTMGEEGNADVLLVHSPAAEEEFMAGGFGAERLLVMHNDFILVGPAADPAGVAGMTSVEAFQAIALAGAPFISRGDDSGTHKKEQSLWSSAGIDPAGQAWFTETGQGMGASLTIASELEAYILTDRATFLANGDNLELEILSEGDAKLLNIYHVITVNPDLWPNVNAEGATAFAAFVTSPEGQEIIAGFGVEEFGQPLFTPDAGKDESTLGMP